MKNKIRELYKILPENLRNFLDRNLIYIYKSNMTTLIEEDQLSPVINAALEFLEKNSKAKIGDYLEFGVYNGTSMSLAYKAMQEHKNYTTRLFGFDSFEGLPSEATTDDDATWFPGQFKCTYDTTVKRLKSKGIDFNRVHLIKGFYSDTLNQELKNKYDLKTASLIMIDCDLYSSTKDALAFCKPLIQDKTIIIFDDWLPHLAKQNLGEKKAFDEFLDINKDLKSSLFHEYKFKGRNSGKAFLVEKIS